MDRITLTKETFKKLFGGEALSGKGSDPELMDVLQKFIFGEVFHLGDLTDRQRELITIVTLTTIQTLPQLKVHAAAALNIGVSPIEVREAVYQTAPLIGYPKTLNAVNTINEVFKEKNIFLPLESESTAKEENRFEKGKAVQDSLYGNEIKDKLKALPGSFKDDIPRFLTEVCFGDYYTRGGLDVQTRELLTLCALTAIGAEKQIKAHVSGNIKAGNSREIMLAAMVQLIGYIGFPNVLNTVYIINDL